MVDACNTPTLRIGPVVSHQSWFIDIVLMICIWGYFGETTL
jgi:hypothetical protein